MAGPSHDHGDVDAALIQPLFAPDVWPAVIAEIHDDRVVRLSFLLQPFQGHTNLRVEHLYAFEVVCPVSAGDWVIRVVGGQIDLRRVDGVSLVPPEFPVRHAEIHLREERLTGAPLRPVRPVKGGGGRSEVPVRLARLLVAESCAVARVVARSAEEVRNHRHRALQRVAVIAVAAVVVRADAGLVHAGHEPGARGRAHRCGDKGVCKPGSFAGQPVEVRGFDERVPIAAHVRRGVLGDQPEDVGSSLMGDLPGLRRSLGRAAGQQCGCPASDGSKEVTPFHGCTPSD